MSFEKIAQTVTKLVWGAVPLKFNHPLAFTREISGTIYAHSGIVLQLWSKVSLFISTPPHPHLALADIEFETSEGSIHLCGVGEHLPEDSYEEFTFSFIL